MTAVPDVQVAADLGALEQACDLVAERLNICAAHVNEGRLDENQMMIVIHRLAARLMGQP
jgi:hypothetical protein